MKRSLLGSHSHLVSKERILLEGVLLFDTFMNSCGSNIQNIIYFDFFVVLITLYKLLRLFVVNNNSCERIRN
jgi:hypothetical protein